MRQKNSSFYYLLLLLAAVLLLPTAPYRTTLDWNEEMFGFSENKTTVSNMQPLRVGHCKPKGREGREQNLFACNPDVMFIGASKCGTSSIAEHLQHHPMMQNIQDNGHSRSNEAHLFDGGNDNKAVLHYIRTSQPAILDLATRHLVMEYTPNYFVVDDAPRRIKAAFPDSYNKLKFIVLLRDPTARTISSFIAKHGKGYDPSKFRDNHLFETCVNKGIKMGACIEKCFKNGMFNRTVVDNRNCNIESCRKKNDDASGRCGGNVFHAHVVKSLYAYQLLNWFKVFERSQFYIFTIEQYSQNPIWVLEKVINYLGLPLYDSKGQFGFKSRAELIKILRIRTNVSPHHPEIDNQVTDELKAKLKNFFKPHNRLLKDLLGWDPGYVV